jgi:hypothetical protein
VQNVLDMKDLGIGTSANTFLRQMGGVFGVGIFGAYFASRVLSLIPGALDIAKKYPGVDRSPIFAGFQVGPEKVAQYPDELRTLITGGFADTVAHIFLFAAPVMLLGFLAVVFLKEIPLRSTRNVGGSSAPATPATPAAAASPPGAPARPSNVSQTAAEAETVAPIADLRLRAPVRIAPTPNPAVTLAPASGWSASGAPRDQVAARLPASPGPRASLRDIQRFVDGLPEDGLAATPAAKQPARKPTARKAR